MGTSKQKGGTEQNLRPNMRHIFYIAQFMAPYFVTLFFVFHSCFTQSVKGILLFFGVILLSGIVSALNPIILNNQSSNTICNLFGNPNLVDSPLFSSSVYSFILMYLLLPMLIYQIINYAVISLLLMLLALDIWIKTQKLQCAQSKSIVFGIIIGLLFGIFYTFVIMNVNKESLFYSEYVSEKLACSLPSKQQFKCHLKPRET